MSIDVIKNFGKIHSYVVIIDGQPFDKHDKYADAKKQRNYYRKNQPNPY